MPVLTVSNNPMSNSAVQPALPASDLRSDSKAYQRNKSRAAKWARGARPAPGRRCVHDSFSPCSNECSIRPTKPLIATYNLRSERASVHANTHAHRQGNIAKKVLQNDVTEITAQSDTSDEEPANYNDASLPEEFVYSYDARGPTDGADVLSHAVMQAVKRYENKQVEQLVKNEYDLVLDRKDLEIHEYTGDEEDYDFVEYGDAH